MRATESTNPARPLANPYLAGAFLGLVLTASYLILGAGLGASAGMARFGAWLQGCIMPAHVAASAYFGRWGDEPLRYYLVFMLLGVFAGGLVSALFNGRIALQLEKGKSFSPASRAFYAVIGGLIVGFASRMAGGCTSGQALSGGAMLLTGSLVFMGACFGGGYAFAWFVRRQWHD